jgi:hypothetical protein
MEQGSSGTVSEVFAGAWQQGKPATLAKCSPQQTSACRKATSFASNSKKWKGGSRDEEFHALEGLL